jgi:hypothetical protein
MKGEGFFWHNVIYGDLGIKNLLISTYSLLQRVALSFFKHCPYWIVTCGSTLISALQLHSRKFTMHWAWTIMSLDCGMSHFLLRGS